MKNTATEGKEFLMARYGPGSQTRALLDEKERIASRLLGQGLTVTQICRQLRCSPQFVRQVRAKMAPPASEVAEKTREDSGSIALAGAVVS